MHGMHSTHQYLVSIVVLSEIKRKKSENKLQIEKGVLVWRNGNGNVERDVMIR